ncbi:MAG: peroxiredoxin, partial [Desulfobacter sp.]|nr:peroxiredoxin [Desulfobacter sp.]
MASVGCERPGGGLVEQEEEIKEEAKETKKGVV